MRWGRAASFVAFTIVMGSTIANGQVRTSEATVDATLPAYEPAPVTPPAGAGYVLPDGSIRLVGLDDMAGVIERLNAEFIQKHPGMKFQYNKGNNVSAMSSLTFGTTAFAPMSTEYSASAMLGYSRMPGGEPLAIRIAHGSLNPSARVSPVAVIVNKNNPLDSLTTSQVTRVFAAGAPGGDLTQWSQLGVRGNAAGRDIHPCGLPESDYYRSEDQTFGAYFVPHAINGLHFAATYEALENYSDVVRRVSADPQAIGLVALNRVTPDVKIVGLRKTAWSTPSRGTAAQIQHGTYPYDRYLYLYVRMVPGQAFDSMVREYLRLVLSREGQEAIAGEAHGFLPLSAREVQEELAKLAEYAP